MPRLRRTAMTRSHGCPTSSVALAGLECGHRASDTHRSSSQYPAAQNSGLLPPAQPGSAALAAENSCLRHASTLLALIVAALLFTRLQVPDLRRLVEAEMA